MGTDNTDAFTRIDRAAASMLEYHLDKKINLVEMPELLELVNMTFHNLRPRMFGDENSDPLFIPDEIDIYRIDVSRLEDKDETIRRVTEKRALDEVARQLKREGTTYVHIALESQI